MEKMNPEDIHAIARALAPLLVEQVRKGHHEFWIDPKSHYDAHLALDGLLTDYKSARGIFMKVFLTTLAIGAILLSGWAALTGQWK